MRLCYERAAEARQQAEATSIPERKAHFVKMEKRWLLLARSYDFSERLDRFLGSMPRPNVLHFVDPKSLLQARGAGVTPSITETTDPKPTLGQERVPLNQRVLDHPTDLAHVSKRFISSSEEPKVTSRSVDAGAPTNPYSGRRSIATKPDFLDRLARKSEAIRPFSVTALGIVVVAVSTATLLRWLSGWTLVDLRFGIYIAAIMVAALLAGWPSGIAAAASSIVIVVFAFVPPYFAFKWPGTADQISLALAAVGSLITIYFSHCCRVVWLHKREVANQILVNELQHREKNLFSINQAILRSSLADDPERADKILGRFQAVRNANDLLTKTIAHPITLRELLLLEFAPYGESRLIANVPEVEVAANAVRYLLLLFHELATNAAKYGALSGSGGRVSINWRHDEGRIVLTWTESGGSEVAHRSTLGFGSQLIAICVKALNGNIDASFDTSGFSCNVELRIQ
jgi:two-component sensor histidine kinase